LKNKLKKNIDYQAQIDSGEFFNNLATITKQHKELAVSREDIIAKKIEEYKEKKREYYLKNKEAIKEYNKKYKESLKKEQEKEEN
jgi:hypothetical protein